MKRKLIVDLPEELDTELTEARKKLEHTRSGFTRLAIKKLIAEVKDEPKIVN